MSSTVVLFTERSSFDPAWRPACEELGLEVRTLRPEDLASAVDHGIGVVIDATQPTFDEDELLAHVGLARACGAVVSVQLPRDGNMTSVEDILDELCLGAVARREQDVPRIAALLARRLDATRTSRFEYVTVSPRGQELLAILGDAQCHMIPRPAGAQDDGSDVVTISLSEDAQIATLVLQSGARVQLRAAKIAQNGQGNGAKAENALDGVRLGARLRELRLSAGLTQAELARRTGIHRPN
ncbi:MAG: helix-turn-helix transcriptional regulator, partial [Myxococcales bacterium]|nr:helix-turn-helix transcriptional regulator [Myxococcales bacterium]